MPAIFGPLIFRHVEYYQNLGVSKHIIYLRKESIALLLLGSPKVARLVQQGKVILIMWEEMQPHALWSRRYDQRIVYRWIWVNVLNARSGQSKVGESCGMGP